MTDTPSIDAYIDACPPAVRPIMTQVREAIRAAAPGADERISYRMPSFFLEGALVYYGAFKEHIGLFPPVRDAVLKRACARFAGPKGNLRFPLDEPMPLDLIRRIVECRVRENALRAQQAKAKRVTTRAGKRAPRGSSA